MRLVWTKRGLKRLQSAFDYIADNFYLDYALQFNSDARLDDVAKLRVDRREVVVAASFPHWRIHAVGTSVRRNALKVPDYFPLLSRNSVKVFPLREPE